MPFKFFKTFLRKKKGKSENEDNHSSLFIFFLFVLLQCSEHVLKFDNLILQQCSLNKAYRLPSLLLHVTPPRLAVAGGRVGSGQRVLEFVAAVCL